MLISPKISYLRMKELVNVFKAEHLIYDIDRLSGVVFNIPDIIQSGMIGLLGISDGLKDCLQLIEESVNSMSSILTTSTKVSNDNRFDEIEATELISRLKIFLRVKNKQLNNFER